MRQRCFLILALLMTSLWTAGFSQEVLRIDEQVESVKVGKHLHYLLVDEALIEEEVLSGVHDHRFQKSEKDALNFGVTTSTLWIKFSVDNQGQFSERILRIKNALLDNVKLYRQDHQGEWTLTEAGDQFVFDRRRIKDHDHCFRLLLPGGQQKDYYLRFETAGSMQIPLVLHSLQDYQKTVLINEWSYGLFTGAMLIMVFYNLFLFFGLKDKSYLAYSLFIFLNLLLMNSYSGHNFKYFFGNYPEVAALSIPILMALIPFTVSICKSFFKNKKGASPLWQCTYKLTKIFILFNSSCHATCS